MSALQDPAVLQLPALDPPPGIIPNFANPENKGPTLIVVGALLLVLVIISLANRAYTKLLIVRKTSWDDLTISLSALGAIVTYIICTLGTELNLISSSAYAYEESVSDVKAGVIGRHQYELRLGDLFNQHFVLVIFKLRFQYVKHAD